MSKYAPLTDHLSDLDNPWIEMSFAEIEGTLGFPLPPSARKFREWWSNNPKNHTQAASWLAAGYRARDVDFANSRLMFEKLNAVGADTPKSPRRHPLFGCLAGTVTIAEGVDLTEPMYTDEEIDAFIEEKAARIAEGMR